MASSKPQPTEDERVARDVFTRLAAEADEFEAYAHPHAERIAALADALAKLFHLGRADRASLRLAALAHDLGEVAMKRDYVRRRGPLNEEERLDLARHPVIGEQEAARAGADRAAQLLVRWHQEWWNGMGYPDALRGEQIPLAARILRVADAYCALTDDRPFRRAGTEEEARKHLAQWAGLEFDPRVVRAFLTLHGLPELRSYARRDAADGADAKTTEAWTATPTTERGAGAPSHEENAEAVGPPADELAAGPEAPAEATAAAGAAGASATEAVEQGAARNTDRSLGGLVPESGTNPYARPAAETQDADAPISAAAQPEPSHDSGQQTAGAETGAGGGAPPASTDDENPLGLDRR